MRASVYRELLRKRGARSLLAGLGACALGDGMSAVSIPWLAVRIAPAGELGIYVGVAVAAYALPGVIGAWGFGRALRERPASALLAGHCGLRATSLFAVALLWVTGVLAPWAYVALLAVSSLLSAWGSAGKYTMLSELGGAEQRLASNSLAGAQESAAVILGPALAGVSIAVLGPGVLIAVDAASFAVLGIVALRARGARATSDAPLDARAAESGLKLLRERGLIGLIAVTAIFFFLYGPVQDALPVYVAHDLRAHAALFGAYWAAFGVGALVSTLSVGMLRGGDIRRRSVAIIAGWGACLLPFAFAPVGVTLVCFAIGGVVYGPFIPLTFALFQASVPAERLPSVLAARSAFTIAAAPLGTAIGGPLVAALGARGTLATSGAATLALAVVAAFAWFSRHARRRHQPDLVPARR
jgi:MFS family permease